MTDSAGAAAADGVVARLTALLESAEEAHGVFETAELDGVYDEAWADWYARYAVENGMGGVLGRDVTPEELEAVLTSSFVEFKRDAPAETWAAYTARRIAKDL